MGKRGKYFTDEEFACKCGCGKADVSSDLVNRLDQLREDIGRPITIASGFRCDKHNASEGGVSGSAHTLGLAVDIKISSGQERFEVLAKVLRGFLFKRIGVAKTFIHVDIDESKPQTVVWTY
ncbi:MAG: peptidase M15 [Nitrospirae bacterium]|nr:MAG: peptidase M15 [Nitrospirota bacterium]